jgi:hypothetical protein
MLVLLSVMPLTCAEDFQLSQKEWRESVRKIPVQRLDLRANRTLVCAIPLKEARGMPARNFDPIALPSLPLIFDKIAYPTPIPACPQK